MLEALPQLTPKSILCVAAHADDIEAFMGGTVARYVAEGAQAHYLILTDGAKGGSPDQSTQQIQSTRRAEQQAAADQLGVASVTFADFADCTLVVSDDVKRHIVRSIRTHRPDVVLCIDPSPLYSLAWGMVNHPDHRAAGQATIDAVYPLACNPAIFPEQLEDEGLQPHAVSTLLLANCDDQNYYVDITVYMDAKRQAMGLHTSQARSLEPVFKLVESTASRHGARTGGRYAEAFIRIDIQV